MEGGEVRAEMGSKVKWETGEGNTGLLGYWDRYECVWREREGESKSEGGIPLLKFGKVKYIWEYVIGLLKKD